MEHFGPKKISSNHSTGFLWCDGPFQMPLEPEISSLPLDKVIKLFFPLVSFVNVALYCSIDKAFYRLSSVVGSAVSSVLDAAGSEGSEITGVHLGLAPSSFYSLKSLLTLEMF